MNTILETLRDIFTAILNPSADGLAVFIKFLIIVTVFAVSYDVLIGKFSKRGITALVAGSLALISGLALPAKLALTTGSILASIVIATIILIPFGILSYVSWKSHEHAKSNKSNWQYLGLALMWFVYFSILVYFLAHWGTLPEVYGWVFNTVLVLATLSPIIMIVLLGVVVIGGKEEERASFTELLQQFDKREIRGKAQELSRNVRTAAALLGGVARARTVDAKHNKIRAALAHIKDAQDEARVLAAQATKLNTRGTVPSTFTTQLDKATELIGIFHVIISELKQALNETTVAAIDTCIVNGTAVDIPASLRDISKLAEAVAKATPTGKKKTTS
jgi:hypothetical protein